MRKLFAAVGKQLLSTKTAVIGVQDDPLHAQGADVFASADQVAIATFFANKAVERSLTHKLEDSRDLIQKSLIDILIAYKTSMTSGGAGASAQLAISENLKMLPVLTLGLLKNVSSNDPFVEASLIFVARLAFVKALKSLQICVPMHKHY